MCVCVGGGCSSLPPDLQKDVFLNQSFTSLKVPNLIKFINIWWYRTHSCSKPVRKYEKILPKFQLFQLPWLQVSRNCLSYIIPTLLYFSSSKNKTEAIIWVTSSSFVRRLGEVTTLFCFAQFYSGQCEKQEQDYATVEIVCVRVCVCACLCVHVLVELEPFQ